MKKLTKVFCAICVFVVKATETTAYFHVSLKLYYKGYPPIPHWVESLAENFPNYLELHFPPQWLRPSMQS